MESLIKRFNFVVEKLWKGEIYINNPLQTEQNKGKGLIAFNKLLEEVQELTIKIEEARGKSITKEEFTKGIEV